MASILRKIVKNEAMETDPEAIYNWRVFLVAASVSRYLLDHHVYDYAYTRFLYINHHANEAIALT